MWLNQQTLDAIRIMAHLAVDAPAMSKATDISVKTGITVTNVQKTVYALAQGKLIETVRGRSGGVRLARTAQAIAISQIVRLFEPQDCPINFMPTAHAETALSALLFKAHRGFFQPLELAFLSDFIGNPPTDSSKS